MSGGPLALMAGPGQQRWGRRSPIQPQLMSDTSEKNVMFTSDLKHIGHTSSSSLHLKVMQPETDTKLDVLQKFVSISYLKFSIH